MPEASVSAATTDSAAAANSAASAASDNAASSSAASQPIQVGGKEYKTWDDVGKAYESLQSEHGRWTQQYGQLKDQYTRAAELAQQAERWNNWWKDIQPLWGEDVEDFLRKKMSGGSKGAAQAAAALAGAQGSGGAWDGWEMLAPQEQAQRLQQAVADGLQGSFNSRLAELAKAVQDTLTQKEQWYGSYLNNHLGLLRKAIEHKMQNPQFDIDKTMAMAAQAIGGQIDPIQLGQQLIDAQSFQAQLDTAKKAAYEQGKKDLELEFKNKKEEASPASFAGSPVKFKMPTAAGNPRQGLAGLRENAAEKIMRQFGPQWFQG